MLAAAGLVGLARFREKLDRDHAMARQLAAGLFPPLNPQSTSHLVPSMHGYERVHRLRVNQHKLSVTNLAAVQYSGSSSCELSSHPSFSWRYNFLPQASSTSANAWQQIRRHVKRSKMVARG